MVQDGELHGWKQIADYLDSSVRKAQDDEKKLGLPIRRALGAKGHVIAYRSELDEWKARVFASSVSPPLQPSETPPRRQFAITSIAIAVTLGGTLTAAGFLLNQPRDPVSIQADGANLMALDAKSREVWRHAMPWEMKEDIYKNTSETSARRFQFLDLDGYPGPELLAEYMPQRHETLGNFLYAFDRKGEPLWSFKAGKEVSDKRGSFTPVYWLDPFEVVASKDGSHLKIIATSHHSVHYPNQVVVLDAQGKITGEYWHSGHLRRLSTADLDRDGIPEAILGGANVGWHKATLVVLDPRNVSGASTQPPGDPHQLQGFPPGSEKAVVLFPRSCLGKHEEFDIVSQIRVTDNRITVVVQQSVNEYVGYYLVFELDWNLNLITVRPSDTFQARHREMEVQGLLDHPYSEAEMAALKQLKVIRKNR